MRKREDYSKKNNINLNELLNYELLISNVDVPQQLDKVYMNFKNMIANIDKKNGYHRIVNLDEFKAETLNLITEAINLLLLLKVNKEDFEKHIIKLNELIKEKYPV
jgi:hypothetical protein